MPLPPTPQVTPSLPRPHSLGPALRPRFELKLSTVISTVATLLVLAYYLAGGQFLPLSLLLPVAGQVLSCGVVAFNDIIVHVLARIARHRPIPLDLLTSSIMEVDTRTGKKLTLSYLLVGGFVTLFLVNTPEVLLGTLATTRIDIRETHRVKGRVELACFGGGWNRSIYYTSGCSLMFSPNPKTAYGEIGYRLGEADWVIPRKPTAFYERFAETSAKKRVNRFEKHILVPRNEVAVLRRIPAPSLDRGCSVRKRTDFKYMLKMYVCSDGIFGFETGGPDLRNHLGFFKLTVGYASIRYSSDDGNRVIRGGSVYDEQAVNFPRFEELWKHMGRCFLNAVSFNRISDGLEAHERLAISSLVRVAGVDDRSGFSRPAMYAEAEIADVKCSNVSKWVIVTMVASVAVMLAVALFFKFQIRVLSRELAQWIQISSALSSQRAFGSWPRYLQSSRRGPRDLKVMLQVKRTADGSDEQVLVPAPGAFEDDDSQRDKEEINGSVSSLISVATSILIGEDGE